MLTRCPHCLARVEVESSDNAECPKCHAYFQPEGEGAAPTRQEAPHHAGRADSCGVASLVLGGLSLVCVLLGCCTCGASYFVAVPLAVAGGVSAYLSKSNLRVGGLILNVATLLPAGVLALLFVTGSGIATLDQLAGGQTGKAREKPVDAPKADKHGEADPWPECAAVRKWFRENVNDPASLEIVKWETRNTTTKDSPNGLYQRGDITVTVKYRSRNQFGAIQIETRSFIVRGGKVVFDMRL